MLGACALGDIGQHFPDTDPRYRDADSIELLRATVALLRDAGFAVAHVDATVVIERPKLAPVRDQMRARLAAALEPGPRPRQRQGDARGGDGVRRARGGRGGAGGRDRPRTGHGRPSTRRTRCVRPRSARVRAARRAPRGRLVAHPLVLHEPRQLRHRVAQVRADDRLGDPLRDPARRSRTPPRRRRAGSRPWCARRPRSAAASARAGPRR